MSLQNVLKSPTAIASTVVRVTPQELRDLAQRAEEAFKSVGTESLVILPLTNKITLLCFDDRKLDTHTTFETENALPSEK